MCHRSLQRLNLQNRQPVFGPTTSLFIDSIANVSDSKPPYSLAQLSLEDHSQTVDSTTGYTHRFGQHRLWYATLRANYGSGFPVQFEDANANLSGTLPAHTTFDLSAGRGLLPGHSGEDQGLGLSLQVLNLLKILPS
jgi:hypothetical protein